MFNPISYIKAWRHTLAMLKLDVIMHETTIEYQLSDKRLFSVRPATSIIEGNKQIIAVWMN